MRTIAKCVLLTFALVLVAALVITGCSTSRAPAPGLQTGAASEATTQPSLAVTNSIQQESRAAGSLSVVYSDPVSGGNSNVGGYINTGNLSTSMQEHIQGLKAGFPSLQQANGESMQGASQGATTDGKLRLQSELNRPRIIVPLQNEELWIIEKAPAQRPQNVMAAPANDVNPGAGALLARAGDKPQQVAVPLKHTDVKATIDGYIATVDVTQQYHNPFSEKIEAQYVFPLPANAAVNEFVMTIGDRKIRGIVRERQEAQQIYQAAKSQGYVASLMTQERPNVFTQNVANIEPGKEIDIDVKYFHTLTYVDGWYEWNYPMVVGPRFNPSHISDGIGAVEVGGTGISGQKTEIQYLRPDQRSGQDISLAVQIDAGVKIEQIESTNHKVIKTINDQMPQNAHGAAVGQTTVVLNPADSIPNKDFVLRYKIAGDTLKSGLMIQPDKSGNGGYFTLMLVPPTSMQNLPRQPLDMVFTLDVSGSMNGQPIEQSRRAIQYALNHMTKGDTFQVIRFASATESLTAEPMAVTPEHVQAALQYVQSMNAAGGTMMLDGIKRSLAVKKDDTRTRYVAFLTDGYIGNENEILGEVHRTLSDSRIFSFGVGSSPNRYLLDHMAKMGAGAAAYLSLNDNPDEIMSAYFERISHPALSDVSIDFGQMQVTDVFPTKIPDVFVGRPVILTGRYAGKGETTIHVKGKLGGELRDIAIPLKFDETAAQHRGIASVWARMKIADLADQSTYDMTQDFAMGIRQVALDYGLMSSYTSFVAVDSSAKTAGDHGTTVAVPASVPDGVRYDTTVQPRVPAPAVNGALGQGNLQREQ